MNQNKSCCNNCNCECPINNCPCQNCQCCSKQNQANQGNVMSETIQIQKTSYYSNVNGKKQEQSQRTIKHQVNDKYQEQILKEHKLNNGKILITKEIIQDGQIKKLDQFVIRPQQKAQIQAGYKLNK